MPAKDDQNVTIEEFFEYLKTYLDEKQIALVRKAYEFAAKKHADQKRRSGEPYIIHPTQVANILARMKMDEETLAAAFLHDVVEDTDTTLQQLKEMFGGSVSSQMVIRVMSFGFKYGPNKEADLIFDVRCSPNPYYVPELKHHTGLESCVREYVMNDDSTMGFLSRLYDMIDYLLPLYKKEGKSELVIAMGCTGGKHRSVTIAENLGGYLASKGNKVIISHRDINK